MAALSAAEAVVAAQQAYAKQTDAGSLFESLATAIVYNKPADVLGFIASELQTMSTAGASYQPAPPGKAIDTEEAAAKYMKEHKVEAVLERLFSALLVKKPSNPIEFLIGAAKSLHGAGPGLAPFYTEDDLRGLFSLFDPTNQMSISVEQARVALRNVGLDAASAGAWGLPASGAVDTATFIKVAQKGLEIQRTA